jgi:large subunit ribosomal protein L10
MPSEQILLKKQKLATELANKIKEYDSVMIIGIQGANDRMLSELRARLRGLAEVRVAKNSTVVRALMSLKEERPGIEKLASIATGTNALIMSNISPFGLSTIIDEIKDSDWIKPGVPSPVDVVIPAGDLGLPPGGPASVLTDMGAKIRIVKGMIRLDEDFTLIHAKEKPSAAAASLLMALDIKPISLSFQIKGAWDGIFISGDQLHINIEQYEKDLLTAKLNALSLALEAEIMNNETAPIIIQRAVGQAMSLASTGAFFSPEEMKVAIKRAASSASLLKTVAGL